MRERPELGVVVARGVQPVHLGAATVCLRRLAVGLGVFPVAQRPIKVASRLSLTSEVVPLIGTGVTLDRPLVARACVTVTLNGASRPYAAAVGLGAMRPSRVGRRTHDRTVEAARRPCESGETAWMLARASRTTNRCRAQRKDVLPVRLLTAALTQAENGTTDAGSGTSRPSLTPPADRPGRLPEAAGWPGYAAPRVAIPGGAIPDGRTSGRRRS